MGVPSYSYSIDNLVSTTLDAYSGDPVNLLTKSGEKFLNELRNMGRIFYVKDCEKIRHPLLYGHGENSGYYTLDELDGTPGAGGSGGSGGALSTAAVEFLTQSNYDMFAATRNINMPQSMPPGDVISYVDALVAANLMKIWNEEEKLFLLGRSAGDSTQTPRVTSPFSSDGSQVVGHPMSVLSLLTESVATTDGDDDTDETFAGVKTDDVGDEWQPQIFGVTTAATFAEGISDLQSAIDQCGSSEFERTTHVFTSRAVFEKMLGLLRADGALPDPVRADLGAAWNHQFNFGGVNLVWSRYLTESTAWDTDTASKAANEPILGLNLYSLRMNIVMNESPIDGQLGFIRQIGDGVYPHPTLTNVFKRIEWKRNYSVDGGRRSMFSMHGITGLTS